MKKNRILSFLSAGILLLAGACSNETLNLGANDDDQKLIHPSEGVYMAVNFDLPSAKGTRSYTSEDDLSNTGTEIGKDYENMVQNVAVVLTSFTNQFIAYSLSETVDPVGTTGSSYRTTNKFQKTDLGIYYGQEDEMFAIDQNTGNHKINVFVFCNPTQSLITLLNKASENDQWFDIIGSWDEILGASAEGNDPIWNQQHFLMSNASIATRLIPPTIEDWDSFNSEIIPFNLSGVNNFGRPNEVDNLTDRGNIVVERTSARYDFRDGALDGINNEDETYNGFKAQTYHVLLDTNKEALVDVFLGKMSVVNMNKKYYYLPRVSNNGLPTAYMNNGLDNDLTLCGPEMPWYTNANGDYIDGKQGNYVVDAEAEWKYYGNYGNHAPSSGYSEKFNYPFFEDNGKDYCPESSWATYLISDVLGGKEVDTPENWNVGRPYGTYKIWRYLTEGTIPGVNSQKNAVSNGIIFKGQILPAREAKETDDVYTQMLLNALKVVENQTDDQVKQNHLLFQYGGHLYCGWEHIRRMAIQLAITDLKKEDGKWVCTINRSVGLYNAVYGSGGFGTVTFQIEGDDVKTANFLINGEGNATLTDVLPPVSADENENGEKKVVPPNTLFEIWNHSGYENDDYFAFRDAVVKNKIKILQESYDKELGGWAYYCYYPYWNRHNDNGKNGEMGPMEFAVVRNNVYKLAVTKVSNLGHPIIVANDPDAPTPDTPDEKDDVYITVTCTTLPWVVRLNDIHL